MSDDFYKQRDIQDRFANGGLSEAQKHIRDLNAQRRQAEQRRAAKPNNKQPASGKGSNSLSTIIGASLGVVFLSIMLAPSSNDNSHGYNPSGNSTSENTSNRLNGYGKEIYENSTYTGYFVNGYRHGQGRMKWSNGDSYKGEFVNGKRTGYGSYVWANGDRYQGNFIDGERTGKGTLLTANGDRYTGDFIKGEQTGKGLVVWANGKSYEGDFVNGKRTGFGKTTDQWGNPQIGTFKDGRFVKPATKRKEFFYYAGDYERTEDDPPVVAVEPFYGEFNSATGKFEEYSPEIIEQIKQSEKMELHR